MFSKYFRPAMSEAPSVKSVNAIEKVDFLRTVRKNYVPLELIRLGAPHDGGYLVPDIFNEIRYCFSAGVGDVVALESHLILDYGIECFLCDASVEGPPPIIRRVSFDKKFLAARSEGSEITLNDWVESCVPERSGGMILQMDIEGGEYEVLAYEGAEVLDAFSLMVVEFHNVHEWAGYSALLMVSGIFEKIYKNFVICHIHPNNCGGVWHWDGVVTPCVIEVTFLNRNLLSNLKTANQIMIPHALDASNDPCIRSIELPNEWYCCSS